MNDACPSQFVSMKQFHSQGSAEDFTERTDNRGVGRDREAAAKDNQRLEAVTTPWGVIC